MKNRCEQKEQIWRRCKYSSLRLIEHNVVDTCASENYAK
jgi:hypothetical protein